MPRTPQFDQPVPPRQLVRERAPRSDDGSSGPSPQWGNELRLPGSEAVMPRRPTSPDHLGWVADRHTCSAVLAANPLGRGLSSRTTRSGSRQVAGRSSICPLIGIDGSWRRPFGSGPAGIRSECTGSWGSGFPPLGRTVAVAPSFRMNPIQPPVRSRNCCPTSTSRAVGRQGHGGSGKASGHPNPQERQSGSLAPGGGGMPGSD